MSTPIEIYTDGACSGNPGKGGFGIVMKYKNQRKELSCGYHLTTNNRMELLAVITAIQQVKKINAEIIIYTDSQYVVNAVSKNWINKWITTNFKNIANVDLWKQFIELQKKHQLKFIWVKGHANNIENNRCDMLAVQASKGFKLLNDTEYEQSQNQNTHAFQF